MDTGVIIAIAVAVLIVLAILWFAGRKGRERRLDTRRDQAREIRREAEVGTAQADRTRAEAEAQAAEAKRQDALARERAASAEEQEQRGARAPHRGRQEGPGRGSRRGCGAVRPRARQGRARRYGRRRRPERRALRAHARRAWSASVASSATRTARSCATRSTSSRAATARGAAAGAPEGTPAALCLLAADGPVPAAVVLQQHPGAPGLLRARRRGRVSRPAHNTPRAEAELVEPAVGTARAHRAWVVVRLAPRD